MGLLHTLTKTLIHFFSAFINLILSVVHFTIGWIFRLGTVELLILLIVNLKTHNMTLAEVVICTAGMIICGIIGFWQS